MSTKLAIFFADGSEEIEGLTVVDILRRGGITIDMISIYDKVEVKGSHGIVFTTDKCLAEFSSSYYDGVILPGGLPGTTNLGATDVVTDAVKEYAAAGKLVAAICAAPSVLGACGVLEGKNATSYPGFADQMTGCHYMEDVKSVVDGNIITSRGMGAAIDFALHILEYFTDHATAHRLAEKVMYFDYQ